MEEYKLSKKNIFEHLWLLPFGIIGVIGGVLFFNYKFGIEHMKEHVFWSLFIVLLFVIPALVLHIQYYLLSKNTHIKIDYNSRLIFVKQKDTIYKFLFEDIKYMRQVKTLEYALRGTYFLPWGLFNYTVLYLNNEQRYVITSYLVIDFDLPIEDERKKLFQVFYPFVVKLNRKDLLYYFI